jgi:hypothetical protein
MWPADAIFTAILSPLFPNGSPFQCLPEQVEQQDAQDTPSLRAGFERVFGCQAAKRARNVVFIWTLDKQYHHCDGLRKPSTVVYVEKTKRSIFGRWSRDAKLLTTGTDTAKPIDSENLRALANSDNLQFYRTIVASLGPMRVWWADVEHLNEAAKQSLADPRQWEHLILKSYRGCYDCLPLKNRRC